MNHNRVLFELCPIAVARRQQCCFSVLEAQDPVGRLSVCPRISLQVFVFERVLSEVFLNAFELCVMIVETSGDRHVCAESIAEASRDGHL